MSRFAVEWEAQYPPEFGGGRGWVVNAEACRRAERARDRYGEALEKIAAGNSVNGQNRPLPAALARDGIDHPEDDARPRGKSLHDWQKDTPDGYSMFDEPFKERSWERGAKERLYATKDRRELARKLARSARRAT